MPSVCPKTILHKSLSNLSGGDLPDTLAQVPTNPTSCYRTHFKAGLASFSTLTVPQFTGTPASTPSLGLFSKVEATCLSLHRIHSGSGFEPFFATRCQNVKSHQIRMVYFL